MKRNYICELKKKKKKKIFIISCLDLKKFKILILKKCNVSNIILTEKIDGH